MAMIIFQTGRPSLMHTKWYFTRVQRKRENMGVAIFVSALSGTRLALVQSLESNSMWKTRLKDFTLHEFDSVNDKTRLE